MFSRLLLVIACVTAAFRFACAATIELAGYSTQSNVLGVKIEGEIAPGDTLKLLKIYQYFGPAVTSRVFLWSKGGDVEEAMKIGRLIRRLRLQTFAPDRLDLTDILKQFNVHEGASNKNNNVCASACVLVFAAGAIRAGDLVILHRPFVVQDDRERLSDVEFENTEKEAISTVREYLKEMEFPDYYIERMIATSSQDGYLPTEQDLDQYPLEGMPPSLEEIILSKCETLTSAERDYFRTHLGELLRNNRKTKSLSDKLRDKFEAYSKCESVQLVNLQVSAWSRVNEAKVDHICSERRGLVQFQADNCRKLVANQLLSEALDRGFHAKPGDTNPPEFSVDTSILDKP